MDLPEINDIGDKVKHWQKDETKYYRSLPLKNYIFSAIAILGIIATCLPWADVTVGFYNKVMAVGLHFFKGWMVFLTYLAVIAVMLFNKHIRIEEKWAEKVPVYAAFATSSFTLVFIIWKLFQVRYGVYLCLAVSLLFLFSVWYFNYRNKNKIKS
ncbi:MAG TPA: hypothetical protein PKN48_06425 [Bacteroidales bacterium]|nr:hypothetical protein [Bacteroidales bacterium]